jgi:hypothetical protein
VIIRWSAALATGLMLAACGSPQEAAPTPSSNASAAPSPAPPAAASLDITIAGGQVTPVNAELEANVGQSITLNVTSDADDELHVHAVPEHSFEVRPGAGEIFEFTVDVPGRVEVELHHLNRTVVTIQVRP